MRYIRIIIIDKVKRHFKTTHTNLLKYNVVI